MRHLRFSFGENYPLSRPPYILSALTSLIPKEHFYFIFILGKAGCNIAAAKNLAGGEGGVGRRTLVVN